MKKLIFIALAFVLTLSTQAQNKKAAVYNNKLFAMQNEVSLQIVRFFQHVKTGNVDKIKLSHDSVNKSIDAKILEVSKFKPFEGDNSLKQALINWFKDYEESFENEYKQMLPLLSKSDRTPEDNQALNQMHDALIKEELVFDQKLADVQKTFAQKHKLTLGDGN